MTLQLSRDRLLLTSPQTGETVIDTDKSAPNIIYEVTKNYAITVPDMLVTQWFSHYINNVPFIYYSQHVSTQAGHFVTPDGLITDKVKPLVYVKVRTAPAGSPMEALKALGWMFVPGTLPLEMFIPEAGNTVVDEPYYGMAFVEVEHVNSGVNLRVNRYFSIGYAGPNELTKGLVGHPQTGRIEYNGITDPALPGYEPYHWKWNAANSGFTLDVHIKLLVTE